MHTNTSKTTTPETSTEPRYMSAAALGKILDVHPDSLRRAAREGRLPHHVIPSLSGSGEGRLRFIWDEVAALIESPATPAAEVTR